MKKMMTWVNAWKIEVMMTTWANVAAMVVVAVEVTMEAAAMVVPVVEAWASADAEAVELDVSCSV